MRHKISIKNFSDLTFYQTHKFLAWTVVGLFLAMFIVIGKMSWPVISKDILGFATGGLWLPAKKEFGALPFIYGTVVTSFLSLLFAVPLSLCVALFINEMAGPRTGRVVGFFVEMLAAIPSIVFGMWGLFVLVPFIKTYVQPFLLEHFSWIPIFRGPPYGVGMLTASLVLAVMITPTITAICREVFRTVSTMQKEAVLGLGATRWEMLKIAVFRASTPGIIGASILGLGRAFGETMAVTMVIGNSPRITASLFEPAQTMASLLANQYAEADGDAHLAALTSVGFILFIIALIINFIARIVVWKVKR